MRALLSAETHSRLVGLIYDCTVEPERWSAALDAVQRELGYQHAILALQELPSGRVLDDRAVNIPSPWLESRLGYAEHAVAAWGGTAYIQRHPVDRPAVLTRVNPGALLDATNPWVAEWAAPQGIVDHLALVLARDGEAIGCVGMGRHRDRGPITGRDLAAARLLIPHFQRAAAIGRLLEETRGVARGLADALAAALEGLGAPVLLLGGDAAILHANAAARALLSAGMPLATHAGRLSSPVAAVARAIAQALAACARGEGGLRHRGFGVPARDEDGGVHALHFLPLGRSDVRPRPVSRAVAALFVSSPRARPDGADDLVAALYGLTRAETRVFAQLAEGRSPAQAAGALGVAPSTFHSHLLRVYDKLGVHRQAELVRLAAALASPLAPLVPGAPESGAGGRQPASP
jgi:DNA-binding CsgD family transcriptional regulator